jgi:hypothetical protein
MTISRRHAAIFASCAAVFAVLGFLVWRGVQPTATRFLPQGAPEVLVVRAPRPGRVELPTAVTQLPAPAPETGGVRRLQFYPRREGEWQGMPVDMAVRAPCEPQLGCQLALACREDGFCGPCRTSSDCMGGEVCVLDHCIARASAECQSREDCPGGELCVLRRWGSDAFADTRGNKFLSSSCTVQGRGLERQQPTELPPPPSGPLVPEGMNVGSDASDLRDAFLKEGSR